MTNKEDVEDLAKVGKYIIAAIKAYERLNGPGWRSPGKTGGGVPTEVDGVWRMVYTETPGVVTTDGTGE